MFYTCVTICISQTRYKKNNDPDDPETDTDEESNEATT